MHHCLYHHLIYKVLQCILCNCNTYDIGCKQGDNMGIDKKVLSIRLDEEIINELKIVAKNENRPLSNLIETILKKYVNLKGNQDKQKSDYS